jgi:hypothetical protein
VLGDFLEHGQLKEIPAYRKKRLRYLTVLSLPLSLHVSTRRGHASNALAPPSGTSRWRTPCLCLELAVPLSGS